MIRTKHHYEVNQSRRPRERVRRLVLRGRIQVVGIVGAALLFGVGGFTGLRQTVQRMLSYRSTPLSALDRVTRGHIDSDRAALPLPSVDEVIVDALAWQPPVAADHPSPADARAALPIATGDHALGSHLAPITLLLFGDLQCRYALHTFRILCRRVQEQPTEYRLVWRERPLDIHPDAPAMAAEAEQLSLQLGEPAFWRFVQAISRLKGAASLSDAKSIARALQAGAAQVNDSVAGERAASQIDKDQRVALTYAVHATPTLFINGLRIEGDFADQELDELIEEELDAVDLLQQEPVPQEKIYATRVHANLLDLDLD